VNGMSNDRSHLMDGIGTHCPFVGFPLKAFGRGQIQLLVAFVMWLSYIYRRWDMFLVQSVLFSSPLLSTDIPLRIICET
jgi:hypothetical protein